MSLSVEIVGDIGEVAADDWNALCVSKMGGANNPFVEHAFLHHLETSGSVGPNTGWLPAHLLLREQNEVLAAMPLYLKEDSYGEYIFDWGWADASHRAGIPYYPKLVSAIPFTPATGPRVLCKEGASKLDVLKTLKNALPEVAKQLGASGVHILFCLEDEAQKLSDKSPLFARGTHQFHFRNAGYKDFDDFLSTLRSKARKQIRKERRKVRESELELSFQKGSALSDDDWSRMYDLYQSTANKKWGRAYLTEAFFTKAKRNVGHLARVGLARREGEIVGGALSFEKGDHIYGRYWGALEELEFVHFELCYYALVEHAIDTGLTLVEAGAQGAHKIKRGFLPVVTHSAHYLEHPGLHQAIERAMVQERVQLGYEIEHIQKDGPFREDALPPFRPSAGIDLRSKSAKTNSD